MYHSLESRTWFLIILLPLKESLNFLLTFNYFASFGVIENRLTKTNFKCFNGNCWASSSFSYSLKITYILLSQVISLKKKVVLSYGLLFHLILLSALMKLASTAVKILCNSMESRHPWRTNIRIKGSDKMPFILILDSILVYATLIMWMNLPPYPNLRKAEKIKSTLKDITRRFLFSLFDSISYVTNIRKSVCSQVSNR